MKRISIFCACMLILFPAAYGQTVSGAGASAESGSCNGYGAGAEYKSGTKNDLSAADGLTVSKTVELSLEECQNMAMENNAGLLNSRLDIEAAIYQKKEALGEYFPRVSVNALGFHAFDPMLEIGVKDILGTSAFTEGLQNIIDKLAGPLGINSIYSTLKHGVTATVSAIQPLFAGGRIVNGNKLAALGIEAAGLQYNIKLRATKEEIEESYWKVVSLDEKLQTINQLQGLVDTLYKDVASACRAGLATDNDLLQVRLKQNELRSGKIQLKNGVRLAKMALFNSIGQKYNPYSTIVNDSIPYIDNIALTDRLDAMLAPENYYRNEDDVTAGLEESKLLDLSVRSKQLEKKMAIGETLPQIGIGASYGYGNIIDKGSFNGAVFASVQIPLSDWGKTARKIQRYNTQIQKAENDKEFLNAQLTLQVRQLWFNLTAAWEQLLVSEESVEAARSSVRQLDAHYRAGLCPLSELLQAQTQLRQVSEMHIDQSITYRTALQAYLNRTCHN